MDLPNIQIKNSLIELFSFAQENAQYSLNKIQGQFDALVHLNLNFLDAIRKCLELNFT